MARLALWIAWIALLAAPCLAVAADKTAKATAPARNDQTANGKTGGDKAVNAKGEPAEKKGKPRKLSPAEQFLRNVGDIAKIKDDCQQPIEDGEWLEKHLFGRKFDGYVPWNPFNF